MKKKFFETDEFKREQAKWYQKLADEGFEDIEDDIPWRLKGSTAMVGLSQLKGELGNEYDAHEIDEMLDDGAVVLQFPHSLKAEYHTVGMNILVVARRQRLDPEMLEAWSHHLNGDGERTIADEMGIARSKVRKYLGILKKSIENELDPVDSE